jgi:hypothetical protein
LQLLIRLVAFVALGMLGLSFGTVFAFLFVALPVYSAVRLGMRDHDYVFDDGPRVAHMLRWFAAISAWAGLISERLPGRDATEVVTLAIDEGAARNRSAGSAIWRVLTGLPSAIALMFLCFIGWFVYLWAVLSILFTQRIGAHTFNYLVGLQRWSVRLLAYQASLVDEYPPFSFSDDAPALPRAHAAM